MTLNAGFDMAGDPYGHGGNFSMTTAYFVRWAARCWRVRTPTAMG